MKLTKREIELIAGIERNRLWRRRGAWIGLVTVLLAWFATNYFEWLPDSSSIVIGIFLGAAIVNLGSSYSTVRVDDNLNGVLQRYVNSDPEALRQISSVRNRMVSSKLKCPQCEEETFGWWRKQMLGPARTTKCAKCGSRISIEKRQYWPVMLAILGAFFLNWMFAPGIYDSYGRAAGILFTVSLGAIALVFVSIYVHRYVDLIVRTIGRIDEYE